MVQSLVESVDSCHFPLFKVGALQSNLCMTLCVRATRSSMVQGGLEEHPQGVTLEDCK
jgi:hypothetical protein